MLPAQYFICYSLSNIEHLTRQAADSDKTRRFEGSLLRLHPDFHSPGYAMTINTTHPWPQISSCWCDVSVMPPPSRESTRALPLSRDSCHRKGGERSLRQLLPTPMFPHQSLRRWKVESYRYRPGLGAGGGPVLLFHFPCDICDSVQVLRPQSSGVLNMIWKFTDPFYLCCREMKAE